MKTWIFKHSKLLKWCLITVCTVAVCYVCYLINTGGRRLDREFDGGSRVTVGALDNEDSGRLLKLCKVWGLVKYYHPKVSDGDVNWDYELFRVIEPVLSAEDGEAVDELLFQWLKDLGSVKENTRPKTEEVILSAGTDWISDEDYLSEELRGLLLSVTRTYNRRPERSYVSFDHINVPDFSGEEEYLDMDFNDQGYRLLGLFRYWNMIEYYYPYIDIIDEDWDGVFLEFLPRFAESSGEMTYKLACAELTTKIHDSHSYIIDETYALMGGTLIAPFNFVQTGGQVVVSGLDEDYPKETETVLPGDIVLEADGRDIWEVAAEKGKLKSRSRDTVLVHDLVEDLFRGYEEQMILTVKRDDEIMDITVPCIERKRKEGQEEEAPLSHWMMDGNIGFIDPGELKKDEIFDIMEKFWDTKGIIVDLRNYPSDFIVYSLGVLIKPEGKEFVVMSEPNPAVPGEFVDSGTFISGVDNPDYYKGKVALLMNEETISSAEFTIMSLRQAPNAVVIGSPSIGADGNVASMTLPGGIYTAMTSLGVYYPDMSQTQRIGLKPDIFVEPSIQGIREGRDELVEKAVEVILAE